MTETTKLPFDLDDVVRSLPPRRECPDYADGHKDYIDMCVRDFRQQVEGLRPWHSQLADLTVSLAHNLRDGFRNVAKWVDSLIPEFDIAPAPNYAYATRAIGGDAGDAAPTRMSFEKLGDGCSVVIDIEVAPAGANLTMKLRDDDGNAILPFSLTVRDVDSGTVLLQNREFATGAAKLNGVERGRYELTASAGCLNCDFSLVVE